MLWARRRRRRLGQSYVDFAAPVNAPPTGSICFAILRCSVAVLGVALLRLRARLPRASSGSQLDPVGPAAERQDSSLTDAQLAHGVAALNADGGDGVEHGGGGEPRQVG